MLTVAYLNRPSVARRWLDADDRSLLGPMITQSSNAAADDVDEIVWSGGLRALGARVGMTHFVPAEPIWGESLITPRDQTRFFLHVDRDIAPHAYGKPTLKAPFRRLLAGLPTGRRSRYH